MLTILYFGDSSPGSTSFHRAKALERLGHTVVIADPYKAFNRQIQSRLMGPVHFRTGYRLLNSRVVKWLSDQVDCKNADLIWINSGELFGPDSLKFMKSFNHPIVLYNNDDPTGGRDGRRFDSLIHALPHYDLCAVMREQNVNEFYSRKAKNVLRVFMSYDEQVHHPFDSIAHIPEAFFSDVAFIGTWMRLENRDQFLLDLIRQGIPVSIWGDRWEKSPLFQALKPHWRGNALQGRDYVAAIQGAKICLGLLSKGNRDQHTQRSLETTYAGGLFCGERTSEHLAMYREGVDAVFWSDSSECASICKQLLANDKLREQIRQSGIQRVRSLKVGNEDICRKILSHESLQSKLKSKTEDS